MNIGNLSINSNKPRIMPGPGTSGVDFGLSLGLVGAGPGGGCLPGPGSLAGLCSPGFIGSDRGLLPGFGSLGLPGGLFLIGSNGFGTGLSVGAPVGLGGSFGVWVLQKSKTQYVIFLMISPTLRFPSGSTRLTGSFPT